jgi:hypothetical protein
MNIVSYSYSFYGENFSPSSLEGRSGLRFSDKCERGDLKWPDKEDVYDYGFAWLTSPVIRLADFLTDRDESLMIINERIQTIRDSGVEDITLYVTYEYTGQCNLAFEPAQMEILSSLGIALAISCIKSEEEEGWIRE